MSELAVLPLDSVKMLMDFPDQCWKFARRVSQIDYSRRDSDTVARLSPQDLVWLTLEASKSPVMMDVAMRTWESGAVVLSVPDQETVENEIKEIASHNTAIAMIVISALSFVVGLVMAVLGLIAAAIGLAIAAPTGGLGLVGAAIGLVAAVCGLLMAVLGLGGLIGGIISLVISYMPDYIVRSVGTHMVGGQNGAPFHDDVGRVGQVRRIVVRHGARIDAIQFVWDDPADKSRTIAGQHHGGDGGQATTFELVDNEFVTKITGRAGGEIDQITLHTTNGRRETVGGDGGAPFELQPEWGGRIIGLQGRAGARLDAIGGLSEIYGSGQAGGMGGTPFLDSLHEKSRLSRISIRAGAYIDSIQTHRQIDGREQSGRAHGAEGGTLHEVDLGANEVITRVFGRHGHYVDKIGFDIVDTVTAATRRETFGGDGGDHDFAFGVPQGKTFAGVWGRSGAYLDAIGICVR